MADLYADLEWLPRPPDDFRSLCRRVAESPDATGADLRRLGGYGLDQNRLLQLSKAIAAVRERGALAPLTPFKLAIVGNATLEPLVAALVGSGVRHGVAIECVAADYAQTLAVAVDPASRINRWQPDAVLVAIDHRGLPLSEGFAGSAAESVDASVRFLRTIREGFRRHAGAVSILQTIAPPPEASFGSFDVAVPGTMRQLAGAFNESLVAELAGSPDVLLDVRALAETVGTSAWHAPTQWNVAKYPFASRFVPLYAEHVGRLVAALRGKSRRCLVLDLDNTLWGGVIGDDGVEGIVLAQGDATGEAFLALQRQALLLRERGIVLAVSSKNEDATARIPFRSHPEMLIKEHHLAAFQANWNDKATNIVSIAHALALGVDSMVFVDDNPVERGLVREALPAVAVPELPADPALYARTLAAAGYFESVTFSEEDRRRAGLYADNAARVALQGQVADLPTYLASLDMEIVFAPFDATGRARIAQLINKSNQFNLTTRRYTEAEVEAAERDDATFTLQVRLIDRFGDNGMISVVVARAGGPREWILDTWLMSCRVLGRRVEHMVLREVIHHARRRGIETLTGTYIPTDRNMMVEDHYAGLGFTLVVRDADGRTTWKLDTGTEIDAAPMRVDRSAFDVVV